MTAPEQSAGQVDSRGPTPAPSPVASTETSIDPHYARRWLILGVILVAQVMILLDSTVINVALPSAQKDLGFSDATRQWVITAYVLAFGSLLPLGGRLSDIVGRKTMMLSGLVGFAIASAVGGAAQNIETLIVARTVQGVFAAALAPAALSLIVVTFKELQELNKAFAIFGAVAGGAGAIGLLLGGVLTSYASWRWCMYINIAFAVVALVGGLSLLHNSTETNKPRLSIPGTIVGSAALFGLVFGSAKAETNGWGSGTTVGSLVGGALLLVGFVILQKYEKHPLIPLRVLADRNRGAAYLVQAFAYAGMFALFLFLTYYIQGVKGYSPVKTGFAFLPIPFAIGGTASFTQSHLLQRFSMRTIVSGGLIVAGGGAVLLAQAGADSNYAAWVLPGLIVMGIGLGSAAVVAMAIGQQGVEPRDAGTAGAMNNVSQQVGSALGVALLSTFAATATSHYLTHHTGSDAAVNATVHGFTVGYWWAAGIYFATAIVCGALIRPNTRMSAPAEAEALEAVAVA
jgi:EmrB/QacA subfamily drug resistance transporter